MKFATNAFAHRATQVANLVLAAVSLAVLAAALMPQTIRAQDLTLDNFSTGPGIVFVQTPGVKTVTLSGSGIIGGARTVSLELNSPESSSDPLEQTSEVEFRPSKNPAIPSGMIWSSGFGAFTRIDMLYGTPANSLNLNLTPYDRLRVSFYGLAEGLNFNIEPVQQPGVYAVLGCNLSPIERGNFTSNQFTVDFPLADFSTAGDTSPFSWSSIEYIDLIFQPANDWSSPNLMITGFSAIPASDPPGTITCGT